MGTLGFSVLPNEMLPTVVFSEVESRKNSQCEVLCAS
jgi:hypothetical protein